MADETVQTEQAPEATPTRGKYQTHEHDGLQVESNSESSDQIKANFDSEKTPEEVEEDISKAASELGKKGAEAKKAKDAEKPSEPAKEPEKDEEGKSKKGNPRYDPKARMLEATQEAARLKRELAEERKAREDLAARIKALETPKNGQVRTEDPDDPRPDATTYEDSPEGARKLIADEASWASRQEWKRLQRAEREKAEKAKREAAEVETVNRKTQFWTEKLEGFSARKAAVMEKDPAWLSGISETVASLQPSYVVELTGGTIGPENILADEIILSDLGPDLMRYFTDHPEKMTEIIDMKTPRSILRAVSAIEAGLSAPAPQRREQPVSRAPAPLKPVAGSASVADPYEVSDTMSDDEALTRLLNQARKRAG